ncbi:hypothetical protein C8R44DRAFT_302121 [Mycena epipterygia]|nr:hypothetical protein C8R44DRAFT_302121 [Mycena epipterygia]
MPTPSPTSSPQQCQMSLLARSGISCGSRTTNTQSKTTASVTLHRAQTARTRAPTSWVGIKIALKSSGSSRKPVSKTISHGEMKTPIVLAETATDNKNWWILASDEDTSNGDSTQESEAGRRGSHVSSHPSPSSESESKSESTNPPLSALRPPNTRYPESEPKSESTNALRPPPYSLPSFDTRPQSPALAPSVTGYTCDACHTDIPAAHPRVHCRICLDYDMCAVCALGERLTGIHMSAHATAIFRTSGGQNQSPVASQAWISHGANSPSRLETRLQSPALAPSATVHTCDACRTHIPAAHPRVHCRICADYNMCAVCTLGERFAGDHTSAHSTAILRISGGRNRPSVNSRTWISYGAGDSGDFVCKLVVRRD